MNKTAADFPQTGKAQTLRLVKMSSMVAISIVLVYLIHFPIFPAVAFLEYDPADISILIGTFAFGPAAGILLTLVTSVIQGVTVSAGSGLHGIIMHLLATGTLVMIAGTVYHIRKTRTSAVIGLVLGMMGMAVVMFGANLIITPLFIPASSVSKFSIVKIFSIFIPFRLDRLRFSVFRTYELSFLKFDFIIQRKDDSVCDFITKELFQ